MEQEIEDFENRLASLNHLVSGNVKIEENPGLITSNATEVVNSVIKGLVASMEKEILDNFDTFASDLDDDEKALRKKEGLQRFILNLGLMVETADHMLLVPFEVPPIFITNDLPGAEAFGTLHFRKVDLRGTGNILDDLSTFAGSYDSNDAYQEDLLDLYHEFVIRLEDGVIFSDNVIDAILSSAGNTTTKNVASVVADNFAWRTESVQLIEVNGQEIPVFSGTNIPPEDGETASATELISKISFKLGDDPESAARKITEETSAFYMQFADDAIRERQRSQSFNDFRMPTDEAELKNWIIGTDTEPGSLEFQRAQALVEQGLVASLPPVGSEDSLYGKSFAADTVIDIKTAFFLVKFLVESDFLIDDAAGYTLTVGGELQPNFSNLKRLEPSSSDFSLATFVSSLLNIGTISEGSEIEEIQDIVRSGNLYARLPKVDEYKRNDEFREDLLTDLGGQGFSVADNVQVEIRLEKFDGSDVDPAKVSVTLYPVSFGPEGPTIREDLDAITLDAPASSADNLLYSKTVTGFGQGQEYIIKISHSDYENDIPNFPIWIDGWEPTLNFWEVIPPDEEYKNIPGIGLFADESDATGALAGIKLSNFASGGELITSSSPDLTLSSITGGYLLNLGTDVKMARITVNETTFTAGFETSDTPLPGLFDAFGFDIKSLVSSLDTNSVSSVTLPGDEAGFESFFEFGSPTYLLKDVDGAFWMIEIRYIDIETGFMDIGFLEMKRDGSLDVVEEKFDEFNDSFDGDFTQSPGAYYTIFLFFGDYLDVEKSFISAPDEDSLFGYDAAVVSSSHLRYAGDAYDEAKATGALDSILGSSTAGSDFSSVPSRLDWVSSLGGLAEISYNSTSRSWTVPTSFDETSISGLEDGDVIAFSTDGSDFTHAARVQKDPNFNGEILLEVVDYSEVVDSTGVVIDLDSDGTPKYFDPNDNDSTVIPGSFFSDVGNDSGGDYSPLKILLAKNEDGETDLWVSYEGPTFEVETLSMGEPINSREEAKASSFTQTFEPSFDFDTGEWNVSMTKGGSTVDLEDSQFSVTSGRIDILVNLETQELSDSFGSGNTPYFKVGVSYGTYDYKTDAAGGTTSTSGIAGTTPSSDEANAGIPDFEGVHSMHLNSDRPGSFLRSNVKLTVGRELPESLTNGFSIDGGKDLELTWSPVSGASEYEVKVEDDFGEIDYTFWVSVVEGEAPSLFFHGGLLFGGRNYRFTLIAKSRNALGETTDAISHTTFRELFVSGGGDEGFFPVEEGLEVGETVVFGDMGVMVGDSTTPGNLLFSVVSVSAASTNANGAVEVDLAPGVELKTFGGEEKFAVGELLEGKGLYIDDLTNPTGGRIDGDTFIDDFESEFADYPLLVRSGNFLIGNNSSYIIFDPESGNPVSSIDGGGFYGIGTSADNLLFAIDIFYDGADSAMAGVAPDGTATAGSSLEPKFFITLMRYPNEEKVTGSVTLESGSFNVFVLEMGDDQIQEVEMEFLYVDENTSAPSAKVAFFVRAPVDKLGSQPIFDLDKDGVDDVEVITNTNQTVFISDAAGLTGVAMVSYYDAITDSFVDQPLSQGAPLMVSFDASVDFEVELDNGRTFVFNIDIEGEQVEIFELESFSADGTTGTSGATTQP